MADFDPIRVKPGELTFAPLFPSTTPQPPQAPQPTSEQIAQAEEARRHDEELTRWHTEQERTAPGRYEVLDQRDLAARQERWKRERASGGLSGDVWRGLQIGADSVGKSALELAKYVPVFGPSLAAGAEGAARLTTGRSAQEFLDNRDERLRAEQTPEYRQAQAKKAIEEVQNPDGSVSYRMGEGWNDPRWYLSNVVESIPSTVLTLVPSTILFRAASTSARAAALARGLGKEAAGKAAAAAGANAAVWSGRIGEGLLSAGQTIGDVREQIAKLPEETLQQSDAYRALLSAGMTPAAARTALANDMSLRGGAIAGILSGTFGGFGDKALLRIFGEGVQGGLARRIASGVGRGVVAEGILEEMPQSAGEQIAQNIAVRGADPSRRLLQDVPNAAGTGFATGAAIGAGVGGPAGALRRADPAAASPETASQPEAGAAPTVPQAAPESSPAEARGREVATGGGVPSGPLSSAVDYATRQTGAAPTTAPAGAPAVGATVRVQMPRGGAMSGVVEGYSADGEPMVRAEVVDPETGEVRTDTLQVPLEHLVPVAPTTAGDGAPLEMAGRSAGARGAPAPAAAPEQPAPPPVPPASAVPAEQGAGAVPAPMPAETAQDAHELPPPVAPPVADRGLPAVIAAPAPAAARASEPVSGTEELPGAEEAGRIPPDQSSDLPPRAETVPLAERPYHARAGNRIIVDDEATVGRFGATIQAFGEDGSVLVRADDGRELQMPADRLRVSGLSDAQVAAAEAKANPPVERKKVTGTGTLGREVAGKQVVFPDQQHAALFDLAKLRRDGQRTLGKGKAPLGSVSGQDIALAKAFGLSPQRLIQIADDYRYQVDRAAKQAASRTPVKMHRVNETLLGRMKAEDAREARKGEAQSALQPLGANTRGKSGYNKDSINEVEANNAPTRRKGNARTVASSALSDVDEHPGTLSQSQQPGVRELRGSRHTGASRPDDIHRLSSGYGAAAVAGASTGQAGQQRALRARQHPLGNETSAGTQSAQDPPADIGKRNSARSRVGSPSRDRSVNNHVQIEGRNGPGERRKAASEPSGAPAGARPSPPPSDPNTRGSERFDTRLGIANGDSSDDHSSTPDEGVGDEAGIERTASSAQGPVTPAVARPKAEASKQEKLAAGRRALEKLRHSAEQKAGAASEDADRAAATMAEFSAEIGGGDVGTKVALARAIQAAAQAATESQDAEPRPIGRYGAFPLSLRPAEGGGVTLVLHGTTDHALPMDMATAKPGAITDGLDAALKRMVAARAETHQRLADIDQDRRRYSIRPEGILGMEKVKEPVAVVDGTELGVEFRDGRDMPALRRAAQRWYDENLVGTTVTMADGTEVHFNKRGMRESTHGRKGDLLLRAVPAIRAIVEKGTIVSREPGDRQSVRERVLLSAPVVLMGVKRRLGVSVHRLADGQVQYDFSMPWRPIAGPGVGVPGGLETESRRSADESARDQHAADDGDTTTGKPSVRDDAGNLNLFVWQEPAETVAAVRADVARHELGGLVGKLIDRGRIHLASEVPEGAPAGAQGWTAPDGTITLVAPALAGRSAMPVILHEMFHSGVRPLVGDAAWNRLLADLGSLHRQFRRPGGAARVFFDRARERAAAAGVAGDLTAEEFGAYAIEEYEVAPRALRNWVAQIVGRVKAWVLARFGRQVGQVTPAQLRALAVAALRSQAVPSTGRTEVKTAGAPPAGAKFSIQNMRDRLADIDRRRLTDAISGKATDIQPFLLGWVPLNYFSELRRPNMTAVDAYLRLKREMDTYRGRKNEQMVEIAEEWRKFASAYRAGATEMAGVMHEATLMGFDPAVSAADPTNTDQVALTKRWAALPPKAQEIYAKVRDAYAAQQRELDEIILANVDKAQLAAQRKAEQDYQDGLARIRGDKDLTEGEKREKVEKLGARHENDRLRGLWAHKARMTRLRQKFEANRVPSPYFPLTRFGRYFVTIRDVEGKAISFSRFETEAARRRWVRENWAKIEKDEPGATKVEGVLDETTGGGQAMDARIIGEIETLMNDAGVGADIMDAIWQRYLSTMPDFSIRKRYIHRKGTAGFQADALRSFAHHMFHAGHQMGRLKYAGDLQESLNDAADQARRADDPTRGTTLVNELRKRHNWVMNPTGRKWVAQVTSIMFVWYLAATPAAAALNMTQPALIGLPVLGAKLGGIGKASAVMMKTVRDTVAGRGTIANSANLTGQEKAAIQAAYDAGAIDRTQSHDMAGIGDSGVEYSPLRHRVMLSISKYFHLAEVWNREVTILTGYRLAREAGQTHHEAIDTAIEMNGKINFDPTNTNRPRHLQTDGWKLVAVFQSYQINTWYRIFRDIHQSFKGETPQARREARYQLSGILGMMALLSGVSGVAGYSVLMAVAGMIFGNDDDPFEFANTVEKNIIDIFGRHLGGMIVKGVPGYLTGVDLTSRIGMPEFLIRAPNDSKDPRSWWQQYVVNALGVVPSTALSIRDGASLVAEGKVWRGVEAMAPKAVRDLLKAARYQQEGVVNRRGDEVMPRDQMSAWNIIAQASGFTPAPVAETYERASRLREAQNKVMKERRELMNRYALAVRLGDQETVQRLFTQIERWNARPYARGLQITGDALRQSLAARQRNAMRREDGVIIQNDALSRTLREGLGQRVFQ